VKSLVFTEHQRKKKGKIKNNLFPLFPLSAQQPSANKEAKTTGN